MENKYIVQFVTPYYDFDGTLQEAVYDVELTEEQYKDYLLQQSNDPTYEEN